MEELNRQKRVIDMMITMHAILTRQNRNWALIFDLLLLLFAVILNTFVFFDNNILGDIDEKIIKIIIGVVSVIIFFISLVVFRVEWKKLAEQHEFAMHQLTKLKIKYNLISEVEEITAERIKKITKSYLKVMEDLPKIPNSKFNNLKKKHLYKIELSKLISKNPTTPIFILKLKLLFGIDKNDQ